LRGRKQSYFLLKLLLVLVGLVLGLFGGLQSRAGKRFLAERISVWASGESLQLRVEGIEGFVPFDFRVRRLTIGDATGVWLEGGDLRCRWGYQALRHHLLRFDALAVEEVTLHRVPQRVEGRRSREGFVLPALPVAVAFEQVSVGVFRINETVMGEALAYSIEGGQMRLRSDGRVAGSVEVRGDAVGSVAFEGRFPGEQEPGNFSLEAELEALNRPRFGLDEVSGRLELTVSESGLAGRVEGELKRGLMEVTAEGAFQYADQRIELTGLQLDRSGISVSGEADLMLEQDGFTVDLDGVVLDSATNRYLIGAEGRFDWGPERWVAQIDSLALEGLDGLRMVFRGSAGSDALELIGTLAPVDLSSWSYLEGQLSGLVHGAVRLRGTLAEPVAEAALQVSGFRSGWDLLEEVPALDFRMDARLDEEGFFASSAITNAVYGVVKGEVKMPGRWSLYPAQFSFERDQLKATLAADMDLSMLNTFPLLAAQRIAGWVDADLVWNGVGQVTGTVLLKEGFYEHYDLGVVMRDVVVEMEATEEGLEIRRATATDGRAGRAEVTGRIAVWEAESPLDLAVTMESAELIRRDDVVAALSGHLTLGGALRYPQVSGRILVERAQIMLDNVPVAPPPLLTEYDARIAGDSAAGAAVSGGTSGRQLELDIEIDLQDRVFLNASVIDSVWGGTLRIRDVEAGFSILGQLQPIRGYFSVIGKKFRLLEEGRIEFDGSVPPMPILNLRAEYARSDIVALLTVSGRLNNPGYTLESIPALPEDEILAQVLFNRDASSISPYQAYQIAAAAEQLAGGIRGAGWLYKTRQALGMDTLEWREADTAGGSSSIAVGKYLTPELYIEVNSSLGGEGGGGVSAEYEVMRNLTVETSTDVQMRPGIGVNWKRDY
jgi:autotransporter translocation and assembly factor TamB